MPSPSTPRRASARKTKTPPKKTLDLGPPQGPYDNNLVRDRVRQWQAQGGGVITATDIVVEEEEEDSEKPPPLKSKNSEQTPPEKLREEPSETGDPQTPKRRSGRRKEKAEEPVRTKHRSISAPRKRIVSDGHWVKKRNTPQSKEKIAVDKAKTPSWALPDDGIRVRPLPESPERIRREVYAPEPQKKPPSPFDDGIRVYSTPPSSRHPSEHLKVPAKNEDRLSAHDDDMLETGSRTSLRDRRRSTVSRHSEEVTPEKSPISGKYTSSVGRSDTKRKDTSRRKERVPEASSPKVNQGTFADKKETARKTSKGNIFSNVIGGSKKIFSRNELAPLPAPKVPTIESWLNGTPDPFLDEDNAIYVDTAADPPETVIADSVIHHDDEQSHIQEEAAEEEADYEPPVEIPAPLKPHPRRRKRHSTESARTEETTKPEDPNGIWDAISRDESTRRHDSRRRRRRERSISIPVEEPIQETPESFEPLKSTPSPQSETLTVDLGKSKPDLSPLSLKRRGAKRDGSTAGSPKRERRQSSPLKESFTPGEVGEESVVSSANTGSTVDTIEQPISSLTAPGVNGKRQFPSLGRQRLSTIASVETFGTKAVGEAPDLTASTPSVQAHRPPNNGAEGITSKTRDHFKPSSIHRKNSKSRFTKHSDLLSVLSLPRADAKSIRSTRSIRTNRSRLETATVQDVMTELTNDETKYMRELRTLVDGVIPVLLSSVLSKADSAITAGLFSPTRAAQSSADLTKPICEMGIALERLKRVHKRVPLDSVDAFLTWAHGTAGVYRDYLRAWRLGFQDVVVNLAPADDKIPENASDINGQMPRNEHGDVLGENGERVDVAFLLKRPLVRLKYLAKTLKGIASVKPSTEADSLTNEYQDLVIEARRRSNEERGRIEDEAAAAIDSTRARDPRTLGPLAGVTVDSTRRVRARDYFNLTLLHTSGQRIDCRVEILLRDNTSSDKGGDVLICEVDGTGKWLLLPPVQTSKISARNGDLLGEIVVMIRGTQSAGQEWQELLSLQNDDEQTGFEWVQMLGLVPVPPKMMRMQSFLDRSERRKTLSLPAPLTASELGTPMKSRTPSPREMEVPIGEQARGKVKSWIESPAREGPLVPQVSSYPPEIVDAVQRSPSQPSAYLKVDTKNEDTELRAWQSLPSQKDNHVASPASPQTPGSLNEALSMAGSPTSGLRRAKANGKSRQIDDSDSQTPQQSQISLSSTLVHGSPKRHSQPVSEASSSPALFPASTPTKQSESRPTYNRSRSSVPSMDPPFVPRLREHSPPTSPVHEPDQEPVWPKEDSPHKPKKLSKKRLEVEADKPPPPPPHRTPSPGQVGGIPTTDLSSGRANRGHRRTSSPLKHEYEPSTTSESDTESDTSTIEHNDVSSMSDSSSDDDLEDGDIATPLMPLGALNRLKKSSAPGSPLSQNKADTIGPSSSASQAPYRTVPAPPKQAARTAVAAILLWSDKGAWESLHPDECTISVTDGLIEAYDMVEFHHKGGVGPDSRPSSSSSTTHKEINPLIGLELTPLVPIRRGTALDISIRSPPTGKSRVKKTSTNNFMFRSRSPEECEALYNLINYARINNPTWIALQNARATSFDPSFGGANFNTRPASSRGSRTSSWFGFGGRSSYRASSAPSPSVNQSESSIGTMTSTFSALRRLGLKSSRFSIARSTVTSRQGSRANSVCTSSDNSSGSSGASTPAPGAMLAVIGAAPLGLSNAKCSFFKRVSQTKWEHLGKARLTITRPNYSNTLAPALVGGESGSVDELQQQRGGLSSRGTSAAAQRTADDKRVIVETRKEGKLMLDVTLGESCFERVLRTGIAINVYEPPEDGLVGKTGGVGPGRFQMFMVKFSSEADAAYTFSIVGKLRY
ncbi:MAG: hypothetical protein MMC23_008081 [Stictis urceolatum]|nr:hypothetical protein [Stictis urceolata]